LPSKSAKTVTKSAILVDFAKFAMEFAKPLMRRFYAGKSTNFAARNAGGQHSLAGQLNL
jgi:hypothetical protein